MFRTLAFLLLIPAAANAGAPADIDALIEQALAEHPRLAAAEARWQAATARAEGAGSLPDPQLSVAYFIEPVETRVGPQRAKLGLRQRIPWFGELGLSSEMASLRAEAENERSGAIRLAVVRDIKQALADDWYLARSEDVLAAQLDLIDQAESVLHTRYRAGDAAYAELLRVRVERSRLEDRIADLAEARAAAARRLTAALGFESSIPLAVPAQLPATPGAEELADRARATLPDSPTLRALGREIDRAGRGVELAGKAGQPDLTLGLDWIDTGPARMDGVADSGKDPIALSLSINLPLWRGRVRAERGAAAAERSVAEAVWRNEILVRSAALETALAGYREQLRRAALHRDTLLPTARESAVVTLASYRTGGADFGDLLDVQRLLLELELALAHAEAERYRQHAAIEALAGLGHGTRSARGLDHD